MLIFIANLFIWIHQGKVKKNGREKERKLKQIAVSFNGMHLKLKHCAMIQDQSRDEKIKADKPQEPEDILVTQVKK